MALGNLPTKIPIIGVHGAVIFSDSNLPLPMTHSQYDQLLAVSEPTNHIIGVVQPKIKESYTTLSDHFFFKSGTAAKIVDAVEMDEDLIAVHVKGLCRFVLENEFIVDHKFRYGNVSYNKYIYADSIPSVLAEFDKESFIGLARRYMNQHHFYPNWKDMLEISPIELINFITMVGPFDAAEKQAILEIPHPNDQKFLLEQIMSMSLSKSAPISKSKH